MNSIVNWLIYLSSFQGILLALALFKRKSPQKRVNILLAFFLILISITLLGRNIYFSEGIDLFGWKLLYLGDQAIFLFGPLLYFILKQTLYDKRTFHISILHFLPALFYMALISPYIFEIGFRFEDIAKNFVINSGLIEVSAICSLLIYQIQNHRILNEINRISVFNEGNYPSRFYFIFLIIIDICLFSWIVGFVSRTYFPEIYGGFFIYQFIWLVLSISLIALGYHTLSSSRNLNFSQSSKTEKETDYKELEVISQHLDALMKSHQLFLDPGINLDLLAEKSGFKKHDVSFALNKIDGLNFFDYINTHRINHFKSKIKELEHENKTILGIAFDSGFNSKTTFNTSFKKFENMTPKEFIKSHT